MNSLKVFSIKLRVEFIFEKNCCLRRISSWPDSHVRRAASKANCIVLADAIGPKLDAEELQRKTALRRMRRLVRFAAGRGPSLNAQQHKSMFAARLAVASIIHRIHYVQMNERSSAASTKTNTAERDARKQYKFCSSNPQKYFPSALPSSFGRQKCVCAENYMHFGNKLNKLTKLLWDK